MDIEDSLSDLSNAEINNDQPQSEITKGPLRKKSEDIGSDNLLTTYLNSIRKIPLLSAEQEAETAHLVKQGDKKALDLMVTSNLRLVISIAKDYRSRGLPMLDLIEEGNLGLIHAAQKFEPERGFRFSTYATWWIRQRIEQAIMSQGRLVRLPVHVIKEINIVLKAKNQLLEQNDYSAVNIEKLAEATHKDPEHVRELLSILENSGASAPLVKQVSNGAEKDISLFDILPDTSQTSPQSSVSGEELSRIIRTWYASLNDKQQLVFQYRFGMGDEEILTLEDVGIKVNLTRERVRQIQNEVLQSLRKTLEAYGFDASAIDEHEMRSLI